MEMTLVEFITSTKYTF